MLRQMYIPVIQCGACVAKAQDLIMGYVFLESCKLKHRRMSNTDYVAHKLKLFAIWFLEINISNPYPFHSSCSLETTDFSNTGLSE